MRAWLLVVLLALAGCPICPCDRLPVVDGQLPLAPGEAVQFKLVYGDEHYANAYACGLHWYVNEVEGGNETVGTVSSCGRYTAPARLPSQEVWVIGAKYALGGCADCCPSSARRIEFAPGAATTESTASTRRALRSDDPGR